MESIFEAINEWLKELLIGAINGNLSNMFGDVNEKVGTIAAQAGQTPFAPTLAELTKLLSVFFTFFNKSVFRQL